MAIGNIDRGFAGSFPDDLVVDFGPGVGVWAWLNHSTTWRQVHLSSPAALVNGDLDSDPFARTESILVLPGAGTHQVWFLYAGVRLRVEEPTALAVGELDGTPNDELIASFPGLGLWRLDCVPRPLMPGEPFPQFCEPDAGWSLVHPFEATSLLTADLDGNGLDDVVIQFAGFGIWAYMNQATWAPLHAFAAAHVAAGNLDGNGLADLVIDFGTGLGIWTLRNMTTWALLHGFSSEGIVLLDRDGNGTDEVVIDFGPGIGLWAHVNDSSWSMLHSLSPELMAAGRFH
jgi:hypothetical protein